MKIIRQGHFEDKMQVVCTNCEAILEITSEDLSPTKSAFSIWPNYSYTCPCCKKTHTVEELTSFTVGIQEAIYDARTKARVEAQTKFD